MQDLNDKVTGGTLTAAQWNEVPSEIQNVIEGTGQTLSGGDLDQLGKGVAQYAANGDAYTDSGAADAYVLTTIGSKQAPAAYTDGMRVRFVTSNANTGASTVNVAGVGVANIKLSGGADPAAGDIDGRTELVYDLANAWFEVVNPKVSGQGTGQTWQVVARTAGVTYTNSTTNPIIFQYMGRSAGVSGSFVMTVNGVNLGGPSWGNSVASGIGISVTIPVGGTYSFADGNYTVAATISEFR